MRTALLLSLLLLAACRARGPEAPSASENRALDEAGQMLDEMGNEAPPADPADNAA